MAGNDVVILVKELEKVMAEFVKPADASVTEERSSSRSSISTLQELKSKFEELEEARNPKQKAKPQFPRVANVLGAELRGSDDNYEPKLISLGPYHHGEGHLVKGETLKLKLAATYEDMCGKTVDDFYGKINDSIQKLKGCYDPEVTKEYSNEEFSVMMLVDGCFLLFYMFCVCTGWFKEDYNIRYQDLSRLNQDALLLENQLPLELLLKKLMEQLDSSCDLWMEMCHAFIRLNNRESFQKENNYNFRLCFPINQIANQRPQRSWKPDEEFNSCHLLHLFRRNILGNEGSSQTYTEDQCLKEDGKLKPQNVQEAMTVDFLSFRNVKELMAAGIRIKRSPTRYLRDISFTSNGITGCLRLPPITIDNSTEAMFLNLIAYEMTSGVGHDFISYLRFLDSLIDHADDVKELQSIGVLQNNLGTHEQVADFFNTVSANLESNFHAYKEVRVGIRNHLQSHYNSKLKMWMTQCLDTYFGSPWTIIALVGAFLALFLTAVQTYFSAFPH